MPGQHEPHGGGAAARAFTPLPKDEGIRPDPGPQDGIGLTSLVDSRQRFSATAPLYDRYRPEYPAALFDWLLERWGVLSMGRVADVGCGTGISTRQLVRRGLRVVGVDPNCDMLAVAARRGGRFVAGEAVATGLADRSVRLVTVAQAFHWFPIVPTLAELSRVLEPEGQCAAFWNDRVSTPFLDEYELLLQEASEEYEKVPRPAATLRELEAQAGLRDFERVEFPNAQRLDREGLRGRAFSSSYVAHGVADAEAFAARLDTLFDRFADHRGVEFRYRCVASRFAFERS